MQASGLPPGGKPLAGSSWAGRQAGGSGGPPGSRKWGQQLLSAATRCNEREGPESFDQQKPAAQAAAGGLAVRFATFRVFAGRGQPVACLRASCTEGWAADLCSLRGPGAA